MASICLNGVGVLSPAPLFANLSFVIGEGDRVGLVAGNGGGKSTLLRCLAGQTETTEGSITRSRGLKLGFVEQEVPENLLDLAFAEVLRRAIPPADRAGEGWRVDLILDEFEAPQEMRERPIRQLSGGWQRLALIARTWVTEPDALLLDEPTNHLDLAKILLLEDWIATTCQGLPMLIASHDRRFLDACTTRTLFLRPGVSRFYAHPYSAARRLLADDDEAAEAKQAKDAREATRLRQSAAELKNIGINSRSDEAQKKSAQMARRAEALEKTSAPLHREKAGAIRLDSRATHAKVMLQADDLMVRTPAGDLLFRTGRLEVRQRDRILLLGRNGVGKSLLVGMLRRACLVPDSVPGVRVSPAVALGYLDQQMSQLPDTDSPFGFIGGFGLPDQRVTSLLAGAGFPVDRQRRPIGQLSPGQKARLGLLALRLAEPSFYLMDEPTNHVDIPGQEKLEAEILAQGATCILVSHDRSFAAAIATRWLLIEGGRLREIDAKEAAKREMG